MSEPLQYATKLFAALAVTGLLFASGITPRLDRVLYDRCIYYRVFSGQETRNPLIAAIDLNDTSIEILGEEIDTRQAFADIQEVLLDSNASAVYDFLFRNTKQNDSSFTSAVQWAGDTVIAALAVDKGIVNPNLPYPDLSESEKLLLERHTWHINVLEKGKVPEAAGFILPFPELIEAAAAIAHINMDPDDDGIYRRAPLLYQWNDGYIPSLALAAAVINLGIPIEAIQLKAGEYLALPLSEDEVIVIPVDIQGYILIPYRESWVSDTNRISFHTIVEAKRDDAVFENVFSGLNGRIAFMAEISTDQKDFGPTSFERLYPLSGVHTEILSGILDGLEERSFIRWASPVYKTAAILLLLGAAVLFYTIRKDLFFHCTFLLTLLFLSAVTIYRWQHYALAPWYAAPVTLLFFLWAVEFISRLFLRYREQLLLHNALSRYFPHALAQRIMQEKKTDLIPAYKELTILFSDISGFTKWSSDKEPGKVHTFLNTYLENMAEIIFAHGGTVDKFMGDGILAFFGDPFEMPDHCEQCVQAAIAMQNKARTLAEEWAPIVDINLNVRIGINTGKVIVGNLGNKTRIEYTVIGAAVNLAQRMESNAPLGGILVTADVMEKVKNTFTFPEKREVTVKGYDQAIEAYVVSLL